jgi:murein DD-endopeptidase MepM/ murein hydrolase activator NlpD
LSYPGLNGHHRWTAATEHGLDITMVDSRGSWARGNVDDWRSGRVPRWEDWYAYNKKVLAAAGGVVVKVVGDVEFPLDFWNRRDGESLADYRNRIGERQMELFMAPGADPAAVAGGNHIVIRHAGDEYSLYAHLAYGSILVREGQQVVRGEHIAGVGGTGEVPAVHLHFQVSDGPSMTSRTVPVRFGNVHVNEAFVDGFEPQTVFQSGFFVTAVAPPQ